MSPLNRIICLIRGHRDMKFIRNFYGDQAMHVNARSLWRCGSCGKKQYRDELFRHIK